MDVTFDHFGWRVKFGQMIALAVFAIGFAGCYYSYPGSSWSTSQTKAATRTVYDLPWRDLARGMSAERVCELFGVQPRRIDVGAALTYWYYSEAYPHYCYVLFDSDTMTVEGWSEPG